MSDRPPEKRKKGAPAGQVPISNFFAKKSRDVESSSSSVGGSESLSVHTSSIGESSIVESSNTGQSSSGPSHETQSLGGTEQIAFDPLDFGNILGLKKRPSDEQIRNFLLNAWTPDGNNKIDQHFVTPTSKLPRSFQAEWLHNYPWLVFSQVKPGGWCKSCALFDDRSESQRGGKNRGNFVSNSWRNYKKGNEDLQYHQGKEYHKVAHSKCMNFLAVTQQGGSNTVVAKINVFHQKYLKELREVLPSIIDAIEYLGRRGLAFIGDQQNPFDDGQGNRGNFLDLIDAFVTRGDKVLENHLKNCKRNAHHLSPSAQNEILGLIKDQMQQTIIDEIKSAKFFTILADETTDRSTREQLSIAFRYVYQSKVKEMFLSYADVVSTTGENLANEILALVEKFGLDIMNCRGQGYDGAANMRGYLSGVQARIKQIQFLAMYMHCASHALNLCLVECCKLIEVQHVIAVVKEATNFFSESAKRLAHFQRKLSDRPEGAVSSKVKRLKQLCETRWTERTCSLDTFVTLFETVISTLEDMIESHDSSKARAYPLFNAITQFKFVIGLVVTQFVLGLSSAASKILQSQQLDITGAMRTVNLCINQLDEIRSNSVEHFNLLWDKACQMAHDNEITIESPRVSARQKHRSGVPSDSPKEHFRLNLFIPLVDSFLQELRTRFDPASQIALKAGLLVPGNMEGRSFQEIFKDVMPTFTLYKDDLGSSEAQWQAELFQWEHFWRTQTATNELPKTIIDTLTVMRETGIENQFSSSVVEMLKIFATLPVTTATVERSFSALRRILTDTRTTMGEERLVALTLMYIHKDIPINKNDIIDKYCLKESRRNTATSD